jgi:hypothetical protein
MAQQSSLLLGQNHHPAGPLRETLEHQTMVSRTPGGRDGSCSLRGPDNRDPADHGALVRSQGGNGDPDP